MGDRHDLHFIGVVFRGERFNFWSDGRGRADNRPSAGGSAAGTYAAGKQFGDGGIGVGHGDEAAGVQPRRS